MNYFEEWDRESFKVSKKTSLNETYNNESQDSVKRSDFWDRLYAEVGKASNGEIGFDEFKDNMLALN